MFTKCYSNCRTMIFMLNQKSALLIASKWSFWVILFQFMEFLWIRQKFKLCQIGRRHILYVMYNVSSNCARLAYAMPSSIRDIQCFLWFTNFYQKFIKNYSKIVPPFIQLTQKNGSFIWTVDADKAFIDLQCAFTLTHVLANVNPNKPFIIEEMHQILHSRVFYHSNEKMESFIQQLCIHTNLILLRLIMISMIKSFQLLLTFLSNGDHFWKGLLIKSLCIIIIRISHISKQLEYLIGDKLFGRSFSLNLISKLYIGVKLYREKQMLCHDVHISHLVLVSQSLIITKQILLGPT